MQEMTITSVHALGPRYAVILKEKDADRYLPILVGASDANAIAIKLHNPQVSLNLTHDLLCTVIDALGGSVRQVLINALQDGWNLSAVIFLKVLDRRGLGPDPEPVNSGNFFPVSQVYDGGSHAQEAAIIDMHHVQRQANGHSGVNRVATVFQDFQTGHGGTGVAGYNHSVDTVKGGELLPWK